MEASVRLNQLIARMAKQMCRVEPAKAFRHLLLEVEIAICEPNTPARPCHRAKLLAMMLRGS